MIQLERFLGGLGDWEPDAEEGPMPWLAFHLDSTIMVSHDPIGIAKAEAGPRPRYLCSKERVKDLRQDIPVHSRASILKFHDGFVPFLAGSNPDFPLLFCGGNRLLSIRQKLFRIEPRIIAHDLHPDYLSTQYATGLARGDPRLRLYPVQHHHAHIASCLAENGIKQPAIGVVFDGTGYGSDGHIWGGEFLLADYKGFKRLGHLEYVPLPGGAAAIKKPYRMAISYLYSLLGEDSLDSNLPGLRGIDDLELELIKKQLERKINSPLTSSCGRLFDAVSALAGIRGSIAYEAQAAIELEMAATGAADDSSSYPFEVIMINDMRLIRLKDTFQAIIADLNTGAAKPEIALKFHNTVAQMAADVCRSIARETGVSMVALSGGVFQNRLLLRLTTKALEKENLEVIIHRQVPTNDGGISLGQAAIASFAQD